MSAAFFWGLVAGSSLVLGGLAALFLRISTRVLGIVMAFGAGVLISAVAYELVAEAFQRTGGVGGATVSGLFAGSIVFFVGDALLDRMGGRTKSSSGEQSAGSPLAIVLGIVLDGVPESIVLGSPWSAAAA